MNWCQRVVDEHRNALAGCRFVDAPTRKRSIAPGAGIEGSVNADLDRVGQSGIMSRVVGITSSVVGRIAPSIGSRLAQDVRRHILDRAYVRRAIKFRFRLEEDLSATR